VRYRSQAATWKFVLEQASVIAKEVSRFVSTGQRSVVERYLASSQVQEAQTARADAVERARIALERLRLLTGLKDPGLDCPQVASLAETPELKQIPAPANPLVARAEHVAESSRAAVSGAKAGHLPRLVAFASVGALDAARLVEKRDYAVGVGLQLPLFEGLRVTREVERAQAEAQAREADAQAIRLETDEQNSRFDEAIRAAQARLKFLGPELKAANEGFGVAKKRYLALQGTLVDVREALRNLTHTRTVITDTQVDWISAGVAKALYNGSRLAGG
jgi:outer membrane protein